MDMRSAASSARRERHDNRTEPRTRASAAVASLPFVPSAVEGREFPGSSLTNHRSPIKSHGFLPNYSTHVPSKFPSISLKTKKSGTNKVTLFFEVTSPGRHAKRNTMSSKFWPISLKTKKSHANKAQQKFEASLLCKRHKSPITSHQPRFFSLFIASLRRRMYNARHQILAEGCVATYEDPQNCSPRVNRHRPPSAGGLACHRTVTFPAVPRITFVS
jgi:hypothetical protein